jgi:nucleoid-associated protein YgaU
MTGFKRYGFFLVCTAFALLISTQKGSAQTGITYEEYKVQQAGYEKRVAEAKRALLECQQSAEQVNQQIETVTTQVATVQQEIYRLIGSDESGVSEYLQELDRIEARLMGLLSLSDEALFDRREEVDQVEARVEGLTKDKRALLPEAMSKFKNIDQLIERIKARMPRKRIRQYSVLKGDSLWKIAKKPDIYDDPYMWPRIYVENRSLIKDPDLIYPNWMLNVPFGVDLNQYLTLRGDNLSKIAGIVYKDVTSWRKIYQANKTQILDPSLVFPAQVLDIPAN